MVDINHLYIRTGTLVPYHEDFLPLLKDCGYLKPKQLIYWIEPDGPDLHVFVVDRQTGASKKSTVMTLTPEEMNAWDHDEYFVMKLREHGLDGDVVHHTDDDGELINENCYVLAMKRKPFTEALSDLWGLVHQAQDYMHPADWQRFKDAYDELEKHK